MGPYAPKSRTVNRWLVILGVVVCICLAGCGRHKAAARPETAADVERQLMSTHTGLLANPASVSCRRASAKWWHCEVTMPPHDLGTSTALVDVKARDRLGS